MYDTSLPRLPYRHTLVSVGRLKPRATRQLVLSGRVLDYACQIGWTLGKAQDTPQGIRDLARGDDDDMAFD